MRFVQLATIDDQTVVITPRFAGQVLRVGDVEIVTRAGRPVRYYGTGTVELSDGYWDEVMITDGDYAGDYRDGDSRGWQWDGTPHASRSRTSARPSGEHVPYTDLAEAYDTATAVNTLDVVNRGRVPSMEVREGWIVQDTEETFIDQWSRDRYDERADSVDTQLPPSLVQERAAQLLENHAEPTYAVRQVSIMASDYAGYERLDNGLVTVERNGRITSYRVVGQEHEITPMKHKITYQTERYVP